MCLFKNIENFTTKKKKKKKKKFQIKYSDVFHITKTRIFKYTENFTTEKGKFSDKKNSDIFSYFCSKHRLLELVRTASARRL